MRQTITTLLLTAAAIALPAQASEAETDTYYGVTLVDPETETLQANSYITVSEGKIVAIGQGTPPESTGGRMHDHSGHYAMPGLIDTHAHVTWGPVGFAMADGVPMMVIEDRPDITAFNARQLLAFGVTTIRNPAGDMAANRAYSEMRAKGELIGPEAFHAAEVIDRLGVGVDAPIVQPGPELSVREIVANQAAAGADFIKLYTGLTEQDLKDGIDEAHAHGLETIAHLSDVSWGTAAELGIDALVHMMPISPDLLRDDLRESYIADRRPGSFQFFEWYEAADLDAPAIRQMLGQLASKQVYLDTTLSAFEPAFFGNRPSVRDVGQPYAHPDMAENWRTLFRFDLGWQEADFARAQAVWPKALELTRLAYEAGVPLTIGTDLANPFVAPGIAMSREMELHRQAGIPAWAVMRMATINGARLLHIEHRTGRIAVGNEADILFTRANPIESFANLAEVALVLSDGEQHHPDQIRKTLGETQ